MTIRSTIRRAGLAATAACLLVSGCASPATQQAIDSATVLCRSGDVGSCQSLPVLQAQGKAEADSVAAGAALGIVGLLLLGAASGGGGGHHYHHRHWR